MTHFCDAEPIDKRAGERVLAATFSKVKRLSQVNKKKQVQRRCRHTHAHTHKAKIGQFPQASWLRAAGLAEELAKWPEIPSPRLVIHNQKGRQFFPSLRCGSANFSFFFDDDELSVFLLPANAPESESVEPESCWKLDADVLMNDVGLFSVLRTAK